jgi:hypothetical protein
MKEPSTHIVTTEEPDATLRVHKCVIKKEMDRDLGIVPSSDKARHILAIRRPSYSF